MTTFLVAFILFYFTHSYIAFMSKLSTPPQTATEFKLASYFLQYFFVKHHKTIFIMQ